MPSYIASSAYPESTRSHRSSHEYSRHSPTASVGSRRSRSANGSRSGYYDRGAYTQGRGTGGSGYAYGSNQPYGHSNQAYLGDTGHRGHHYHTYPQQHQQQRYYAGGHGSRNPQVVYAPSGDTGRRHERRYSTGSAYYVAPSTVGSSGSRHGRQVQYAYPSSQNRDYGNSRREYHYVSDSGTRDRGRRAYSSVSRSWYISGIGLSTEIICYCRVRRLVSASNGYLGWATRITMIVGNERRGAEVCMIPVGDMMTLGVTFTLYKTFYQNHHSCIFFLLFFFMFLYIIDINEFLSNLAGYHTVYNKRFTCNCNWLRVRSHKRKSRVIGVQHRLES